MRAAIVSFALLALAIYGCAAPMATCPPGLHSAQIAQLFFGRNIGAREGVSDADWRVFIDAEVTPRFPDGLTITDAHGQWRGGAITSERSKVMTIVLSGAADEQQKLADIRAAYKARFRQDSVLMIESGACAGF